MKKHNQRKEIIWNIINSFLAGAISFFSSIAALISVDGFDPHEILTAVLIACCTSSLVAVYKFKDYWDGEKTEFQSRLFNLA